MTATRQAQDLGPRDLLRTVAGYDTEGTYFSGPLHGGDYTTGPTMHLQIGRQHIEVDRETQLTTTGKDTPPPRLHNTHPHSKVTQTGQTTAPKNRDT